MCVWFDVSFCVCGRVLFLVCVFFCVCVFLVRFSLCLRYVMLCYAMLCYAMLCYVMLCHVMLCYVMLCTLCYAMLCYSITIARSTYVQCLARCGICKLWRILLLLDLCCWLLDTRRRRTQHFCHARKMSVTSMKFS